MNPVRQYMPLMPGWTEPVMYAVLAGALVALGLGVHRKLAGYGVTMPDLVRALLSAYRSQPRQFRRRLLAQTVRQEKVRERQPGGTIHSLVFVSLAVLFLGTTLIFLEHDVLRFFDLQYLRGTFYLVYEAVLDAAGVALIAGVLLALYRRQMLRPAHLETRAADIWVLAGLLWLAVSGFALEGMRLAFRPVPWAPYSFAGYALSRGLVAVMADVRALAPIYPWVWWSHALAAFAGLAALPLSKLHHLVTIPLNIALAEPAPRGRLSMPFNVAVLAESGGELPEGIGISAAPDVDWRRRLNLDACVQCGRCDTVCPALAAGRSLSPRGLVQGLRAAIARDPAGAGSLLGAGAVTEQAVWSCTNCYACEEICPAGVSHVQFVADLRRSLVADGRMDARQSDVLERMERNGNPYGLPSFSRADWLLSRGVPTVHDNPEFEYLYWIGCAASYDPRLQQIALATVQILDAAGVSYAVLGNEERCTGESARRLGEEGRFQLMAMENIALLQGYGVRRILTHCPHCYNVFHHDYPELGGAFEVVHHTQLIHQLVHTGRLPLSAAGAATDGAGPAVTYHDPCNLGRLNDGYDQPRELVQWATGGPVREMAQNRRGGFCCGAGGGNAWYSLPETRKISHLRLEQIAATGAGLVGVACPFCAAMLEDAVRSTGRQDELQVRDVAELVAQRLVRAPDGPGR